ncbi:Phosphoglucomutase [Sphaceloma murrayae]|uniref:Phosphoglucomutase n=1 Tax=Sphaceloma murrayae TaxID=2082308 RepID=A0A2K1QYV0_9PEZI|nr:Phosphoglucomutase [Sphaceloma murrayae]
MSVACARPPAVLRSLDLMIMPDEILLAIAKSHGRFTDPSMMFAVARAKQLKVIDDSFTPVQVSPLVDVRRHAIAQTCRRLRDLFIDCYGKADLSKVYIPHPHKIFLPRSKSIGQIMRKVVITPFAIIDEFFESSAYKNLRSTGHSDSDDFYTDPTTTASGYWFAYEAPTLLWKAFRNLYVKFPRQSELSVHIHHRGDSNGWIASTRQDFDAFDCTRRYLFPTLDQPKASLLWTRHGSDPDEASIVRLFTEFMDTARGILHGDITKSDFEAALARRLGNTKAPLADIIRESNGLGTSPVRRCLPDSID